MSNPIGCHPISMKHLVKALIGPLTLAQAFCGLSSVSCLSRWYDSLQVLVTFSFISSSNPHQYADQKAIMDLICRIWGSLPRFAKVTPATQIGHCPCLLAMLLARVVRAAAWCLGGIPKAARPYSWVGQRFDAKKRAVRLPLPAHFLRTPRRSVLRCA